MYFCNLLKNENISIWECVRTVLTGGAVPYLLSHSTERAFLPFVDKNTKITSQRQLSSQKNPQYDTNCIFQGEQILIIGSTLR